MTNTPYPLGRVVNHDPRSRAFALDTRDITLVSIRHHRDIPVLDQGDVGSCTGNAALGALGSDPYYSTVTTLVTDWQESGAVSIYSDAEKIDGSAGYPPEDNGSSGLSVAKVLKNRGWISGYTHTFSFNDALKALAVTPILVGINWYNNFFNPDASGVISIGKNDSVAGGHEIVADELDMENQRIGLTNSWSESWGVDGRFYIPFELFQRLLDEDGDVTVFVANTKPAPEPSPSPEPIPEPVPAPDPTPAPSPTPDPVVVPSPSPDPTDNSVADQTLWEVSELWSTQRHTGNNKIVAQAVRLWAKSKGLTD